MLLVEAGLNTHFEVLEQLDGDSDKRVTWDDFYGKLTRGCLLFAVCCFLLCVVRRARLRRLTWDVWRQRAVAGQGPHRGAWDGPCNLDSTAFVRPTCLADCVGQPRVLLALVPAWQ